MGDDGLQPPPPSRLRWLVPATTTSPEFAPVRERLERVLASRPDRIVYTAKRRRIYRVEDPVLGVLAIKEIRNPTLSRRLWFGYVRQHRAVREFRVGSSFEARGGRTPHFFGAALVRDLSGLRCAYLFSEWLDEAETLTAHLARRREPPSPTLLERVAARLVNAARKGLVHGRHSSENLLVRFVKGDLEVQTIDFAYASLADGFQDQEFIEDAARVARRLLLENACSEETVLRLFDHVARLAWPDAAEAARGRARLRERLESLAGPLALSGPASA